MKIADALVAIAILVPLAFGLFIAYDGLFNTAGNALPAFDNAWLHVARARVILDTGHYAETELVFGGVTNTYHVPFYPSLVAGFAALSGLDVFWAIRAVALAQIVLLGLAFYVAGKRFSGGNQLAGAAAALLAYNSISLMQWGTRNTAISFGVLMVVFALYFVAQRNWFAALLLSLSIAMDHPPSLLTLALTLLVFVIITSIDPLLLAARQGWRKAAAGLEWIAIACGLTAFVSYLIWHIRQTGLTCLDFKCLPQAAAKEFGKGIDIIGHVTPFPGFLGVIGLVVAALDQKIDLRTKLLLFSWVAATVILVKNDALGAGVFTERFLTFLDEPIAIAGGIFVGWVFALIAGSKTISDAVPRVLQRA